MTRLIYLLVATVLVAGITLSAQRTPEIVTWVKMQMPIEGRPASGSHIHPESEPYKPGVIPNVYIGIEPTPTARTTDGLVISGFSVYGWRAGNEVRVVVLAAVTKEGMDNRCYPISELEPLPARNSLSVYQYRPIATYTMRATDKPRTVDEMKAFGTVPMTVWVEAVQN